MADSTSKKNPQIDETGWGPIFRNLSPSDGSLNVDLELRKALTNAIANSKKKRSQICAEMSDFTNTDVTKSSLDTWTAESKSISSANEDFNNNKRRGMPAELLPAFCIATGDETPLKILAEIMGLKLMDRKEQMAFEIIQLKEKSKRIAKEIRQKEKIQKRMAK